MKKILALIGLSAGLAAAATIPPTMKVDDATFKINSCVESGSDVTCNGTLHVDKETTMMTGLSLSFSLVSPEGVEVESSDMKVQGQTTENIALPLHEGIEYPFEISFKNYRSSKLKYFYFITSSGNIRNKMQSVPLYTSGAVVPVGRVEGKSPVNIGQNKYNVVMQNCVGSQSADAFACTAVFTPQK